MIGENDIRRRRRTHYALAALALTAVAGLLLLWRRGEPPMPREAVRVVIADATQPVSGLVYVAQDRRHFEQARLRVMLTPYSTGKAAYAAVMAGQADVATVAETPLVFAALKGEPFCILATIATTERNIAVVVRADRGVLCPDDLRGKRVGVPPGTNAEFFLETFLITRRLRPEDVRIVPLAPEKIPPAMVEGTLDAAAAWHPHLGAVQRALGDNARSFYDEQIYTWSWNLVARRDWVEAHPDVVWRLLRGLAAAEEHVAAAPDDSKAVITTRCLMGARDIDEMWNSYHFKLTLGQWLIMAMESQAQWAQRKTGNPDKKLPDFRNALHLRTLESIRPEAVTVVR
jgi:NitT/TauT family transport system substrate-binding protein